MQSKYEFRQFHMRRLRVRDPRYVPDVRISMSVLQLANNRVPCRPLQMPRAAELEHRDALAIQTDAYMHARMYRFTAVCMMAWLCRCVPACST